MSWIFKGVRERSVKHRVPHRVWTLLVAQLLLVKTLRQDLVLRHTHNLQTDTEDILKLNAVQPSTDTSPKEKKLKSPLLGS